MVFSEGPVGRPSTKPLPPVAPRTSVLSERDDDDDKPQAKRGRPGMDGWMLELIASWLPGAQDYLRKEGRPATKIAAIKLLCLRLAESGARNLPTPESICRRLSRAPKSSFLR